MLHGATHTPHPSSSPAPATSSARDVDAYLGTQLAGRYKVLKKLGEGGMGVVYLAEHTFIEKKVAIKVLSDDFARKSDLVQRFMQEAKSASKIGHENIIDITDFGETASGSVFIVMEFLDGRDLANHIRESGALSLPRVRVIMNQICRALGAAHSKGIVHRDLKPENIYLVDREERADFVKVLDFGIAKTSALEESGARLTRTGMIFGTPEYMSPEQAKGEKPDQRVDVYAAGCILYELLTGDVPFHAENFMGVLTKHMFEAPVPPSKRAGNVSPAVEGVVLRALAKNRDERFQTMKEMAVALETAFGGSAESAWGQEGSGILRRESQRMVTGAPSRSSEILLDQDMVEIPTRKPLPWIIGGSALAILIVLGLWAALRKPNNPEMAKIEMPAASAPAAPAPAPAPPLAPAAAAAAPIVQEPTTATKSQIAIHSTPVDVEVYDQTSLLGKTPLQLEFAATATPFNVTLRKHGFRDQKLMVFPDRDRTYEIHLVASSSRGGRSSAGSKNADAPQSGEKSSGRLRDLKDPFAN